MIGNRDDLLGNTLRLGGKKIKEKGSDGIY
jgi:hypothetical protein